MTMVEGHDGMNETSKDDNPFHYSATQNAKGFFQIKFSAQYSDELTKDEISDMIQKGIEGIKEGIEKAGGKIASQG